MTATPHQPRVVLAYDGSAAATVAIPWLGARDYEVVTLTLDLGQGGELLGIRERALTAGAARAHVLDARDEFARVFVLPLLRHGDPALDVAHAGAVEARTLLAGRLLDVAHMENAGAIAHGAGEGSALDAALAAAGPAVRVIHVPDAAGVAGTSTLIGRYVELRDDGPAAYVLTRGRGECPHEPAFVTIDIVDGVPMRANGIEMSFVEVLDSLETIAGAHGVGRREGTTSDGRRYVSEAPAAATLLAAFGALGRHASGSVRLRLFDGACTLINVTPAEP